MAINRSPECVLCVARVILRNDPTPDEIAEASVLLNKYVKFM